MSEQLLVLQPKLYKVLLGEEVKSILTFDVNRIDEIVRTERMHHIHILDRSGSMQNHIDDLMEDVKRTLKIIDPNDYVTIIWFSGAGEYRSVVKCAKNDSGSIDKILDSLKSTVGCTCFSDPLKELQTIIDETLPVCDVYNITIFTDGDSVTPWPVKEETRKIFENLDAIKNKIIAFNAVGYGNYYNRELLLKMTKTTEYGQLSHAKEISDYSNIFYHNKEAISDVLGRRMTIEAIDGDIICLTSKTTKSWKEKANVRLSKKRNFYGIISDGKKDSISLLVNNKQYLFDINNIQTADLDIDCDKGLIDILYSYAYNLYSEGLRRNSLETLNLLGDKKLIDRQFSAFTVSEIGEYTKELKRCIFDTKKNFLGVKSNSYVPDSNALCVLDVLKELVNCKAKYYPVENYKRIGRKVVDEFNCFIKDEEQDCVDMSGIVLNQSRLNISLRFMLKGKVKLNPKRAAVVGLPIEMDSKIYRVHTIVQDGSLNINKIKVRIEKNNSALLDKLGDIKEIISEDEGGITLLINLSMLPVINNSYLTKSAKDLLNDEIQMLYMEAESKVVNYLIKEDKTPEEWGSFSAEQINVLKEHGLNTNLVYSAILPVSQKSEDYNVIKEFQTMLKGYSSLPSLNKIIEKIENGKKMTPSESLLYQYYEANSNLQKKDLIAKKESISNSLNQLRFKLSGNKLALILTGEWPTDFNLESDGSFSYSDNNYTLLAKLERKEIPI